ncbi:hypothetical protein [Candidatus Nitrotoga sp. AM1P]|uniref:hypothetical protein n=1 Tax=Candidatus Nitrotoga sp. AM1P TaxID=2559597 RepID=UPI0010B84772|nr:hypothetical protein [Candidatus Nitrotoga sp. AM1P]BBJ23571.1 hypothetical protein W01_14980 [Candidatus Nitrotoga sp. AM1P]
MRISHNAAPVWSTSFVPYSSTPTSQPRTFFQETITDAKGKERKKYRYKDMMTPYEKLKSIPGASEYLKEDVTFKQLDAQAAKMSDNDAALALNNARKKLF